jgi:NAD+ synthase (glutamine-hydrolysing)
VDADSAQHFRRIAGATVLANLSASNITIGKLITGATCAPANQGKCIAALSLQCAGPGESTTDVAWDGHALIYENNELLAEANRFAEEEQMIAADIDLERLAQDRMRWTSFNDAAGDHQEKLRSMRPIGFEFQIPEGDIGLLRDVERFPYVPNDRALRDERCYEAYNIQVHGLMKRLLSTGIEKIVIGVSGGLDSTHALIVAAKTMDRLGWSRENILGYTMPGFATSDITLKNAHGLMKSLGITAQEIDIKPVVCKCCATSGTRLSKASRCMTSPLKTCRPASALRIYSAWPTFTTVCTGNRRPFGLALGWATYGVGDHMSHYNVNASVPKTLIQHLIRWVIDSRQFR